MQSRLANGDVGTVMFIFLRAGIQMPPLQVMHPFSLLVNGVDEWLALTLIKGFGDKPNPWVAFVCDETRWMMRFCIGELSAPAIQEFLRVDEFEKGQWMTRLNIMIVDDARSERILLRHALTDVRRNLNIFEASNYEEALHHMNEQVIECAFLDIQLPAVNGIDLLAALLEMKPDLTVVMVSHHSTQNLVVSALRLGAVGYLVKPFNLAKIKDVLNRHHPERSHVSL